MKIYKTIVLIPVAFFASCKDRVSTDFGKSDDPESSKSQKISRILNREQLEGFLKEGMEAAEVVRVLGSPDRVRHDNGSGPAMVEDLADQTFLWIYEDYPNEEILDAPLILIISSSNEEFSVGDLLVRWFYSK